MGLTIHYNLRSRATGANTGKAKISALREEISGLGFEELGDVFHLEGDSVDYEKRGQDDDKRWFLIQAGTFIKDPSDAGRTYKCQPLEVVGFGAWPGDGSEPSNFGLCRYPETFSTAMSRFPRPNGRTHDFPTGINGWSWGSFCKTQYASDPECGGVGNFVKCHLQVIAALDAAKSLGLLESVSDEGDYWEKRDVQALAKKVGQWNEIIAAMGGALSDALGQSGMAIAAPILERGDFERLETQGLKDPKIKRMAEMIRLTGANATGRAI